MIKVVYGDFGNPRLGAGDGAHPRRTMPRWLVLAMVFGVALPLVVLGAIFLSVVVLSVLVVVAILGAGVALRLGWHNVSQKLKGDGRRNVRVARRPPDAGL
ncbi:MAG: hypothetical protein HKL96_08385 [Phycisphaerales bacterium]|nr:hypothetical protein [Phycisphaerales bacterium]